ncbi:MAG: hypothetical protein LBR53_01460 [Deltaproteobacteria bacterium]|jgi:hypothetical protein|nr:hypothetical protein [Deltaproteobacteria bacterium]
MDDVFDQDFIDAVSAEDFSLVDTELLTDHPEAGPFGFPGGGALFSSGTPKIFSISVEFLETGLLKRRKPRP